MPHLYINNNAIILQDNPKLCKENSMCHLVGQNREPKSRNDKGFQCFRLLLTMTF